MLLTFNYIKMISLVLYRFWSNAYSSAGDTVWMTLDKNSSGTEESLYTGSSTITGMTGEIYLDAR